MTKKKAIEKYGIKGAEAYIKGVSDGVSKVISAFEKNGSSALLNDWEEELNKLKRVS